MLNKCFEYDEKQSNLILKAKHYSVLDLKELLNCLNILEKKSIEKVKISGNFDSCFVMQDFEANKKKSQIKEILFLFQSITKTIEESRIAYTAHLKNLVSGPALEIALSCNFLKAENTTVFKFNEVDKGLMPFFGTIQRIIRLIGYSKALQVLLIKKSISYQEACRYKLINQETDNKLIIEKRRIFWDKEFTETFTYYNTKIHSKEKNNLPAFKAILSSVFEGIICDYYAGLDIEKRWGEWLLLNKT